ncbi:DUF397 domain-containing protein [Actinomadura harenae]|uniref:DUF397 domain-containing protein n=1 Tax=Actinomadura harenae TaxID=2483351 RepID=A0A3M2M1Z9_9ACTN|nr:DUF397 domain-containing protein [Actinomadura harenae]RMI41098.1 DUF397 domain-containing protein [Actinomadura harenae]
MAPQYAVWRKSTHSAPDGECVEAARFPSGTVGVRDSKAAETSPVLELSLDEWAGFLHAARACPAL